MRLSIGLVIAVGLTACGGSRYPKSEAKEPVKPAVPSTTPDADRRHRPPDMRWWQGELPTCSTGELKTRSLSWGKVHWCALPGQRVDASLQNDLGRIARCMHESIAAFQQEPEEGNLGSFLHRAQDAGLNPVLCGAVRKDGEARTYHGRRVLLERTELGEPKQIAGGGESEVRYRFSCEDCLVASEMTVTIAR